MEMLAFWLPGILVIVAGIFLRVFLVTGWRDRKGPQTW